MCASERVAPAQAVAETWATRRSRSATPAMSGAAPGKSRDAA